MEQLRLCVHNAARLKFIHRFALCMHGQAYPFLNAPPRSDDNQRIDLNICVNRNRGNLESRVLRATLVWRQMTVKLAISSTFIVGGGCLDILFFAVRFLDCVFVPA